MLIIVCVGASPQWWGAGRCLSIVVVVGTHGWHWVVVDKYCGQWLPWVTGVMWHRWVGMVGITDDGGGWGRRLFGCSQCQTKHRHLLTLVWEGSHEHELY